MKIHIENMEFFAFHGHFKEEQQVGNTFLLSLEIETFDLRACQSDILEETVDYQRLYQIIKAQMQQVSNLLEHVADRILKAILAEFQQIENATIKVSKINPPLGGQIEKVSITLSQSRK